jgi:hypothetical protein
VLRLRHFTAFISYPPVCCSFDTVNLVYGTFGVTRGWLCVIDVEGSGPGLFHLQHSLGGTEENHRTQESRSVGRDLNPGPSRRSDDVSAAVTDACTCFSPYRKENTTLHRYKDQPVNGCLRK